MDLEVGRIHKGTAVDPLMKIEHRGKPLFDRVERVNRRIGTCKIFVEDIPDPEFVMAPEDPPKGCGAAPACAGYDQHPTTCLRAKILKKVAPNAGESPCQKATCRKGVGRDEKLP